MFASSQPRLLVDRICDHTLLVQRGEKTRPVVFDCGANRGRFTDWAAQTLGAKVYCFEADPDLAAALPSRNEVAVINAAIASSDGSVMLYRSADRDASSFFNQGSSFEIKVRSRSLDSFVRENAIQSIDLLKLDIEGWELSVLETLSTDLLSKTTQITCEFHDFLDKGQIPRIERIIRDFRSRGWFVVNMAIRTYGDVLFVNRSLLPLSLAARSRLHAYKYASAFSRVLARLQ
jgi:FkbM family methyltransferase